jgi:hypothetical protein
MILLVLCDSYSGTVPMRHASPSIPTFLNLMSIRPGEKFFGPMWI